MNKRASEIKHFGIQGFRRLQNLEIEMRPLMVLIGANGVGKTSMLDAFSLLSASAEGKLNQKLNDMGGLSDILTKNGASDLRFSIEMEIPAHKPLTYFLQISPKGSSYSIFRETLTQAHEGYDSPFKHIESEYDNIRYFDIEEERLVRPTWDHDPLETSLAQVPKMFKQPEELRKILSSASHYHVLDVSDRAPVKLPQQLKASMLPGAEGESLVSYLYNLRETQKNRYEAIEDTLRSAFPDFESLNLPSVAAGMLSLTWKDRNYNEALDAHQLSEGTLRFLWLVSLLQSPGLSTITMIDEPEVSLHPEMLSLLADLLREASERTQVIVATHSDRLIRFLEPKEVLVMDIADNGEATAQWADTMDLEEWLSEYSLDEVWQMGRMGGRS